MIMRALGQWQFRVDAGKIAEFARAVGNANREIAPPTFMVVASADLVERLVGEVFGLDRKQAVHGEQSYEYFAPIRAGMDLIGRAELVSDVMKPGRTGGQMRVITVCVTYTDAATGDLLLRETMVVIEKGA